MQAERNPSSPPGVEPGTIPGPVAAFLAALADDPRLPVGVRARSQALLNAHGFVGSLRAAKTLENVSEHMAALRFVEGHSWWSAAGRVTEAPQWHRLSRPRLLAAVALYRAGLRLAHREVRHGHR